MNYGQLQDLVHYGIKEDALLGIIPQAVNDAVRDIQATRSWGCMFNNLDFTITAGSDRTSLGSTFKEFQGGHTPVKLTANDGAFTNFYIRVLPTAEARRQAEMVVWPFEASIPNPLSYDFAWQEDVGGVPYLVFPHTFTSGGSGSASIVAYLAPLSDDADTNFFTINHPSMVVALAKYKVGQFSEDVETQRRLSGWLAQYETDLRRALREDAHRRVAGKSFSFGG